LTFIKIAVLSLAVLASTVDSASGQVLYGSIRGTIEDPGHSVIPGAMVTLTNKNAGSVQSAVTGQTGAYSFVDVASGTYSLTVSAPGFKSHTQNEVEVSINTVARVDVQLQVGQVSERVEVSAESSALQTEKADVHVELDAKEVSELPLPGYRNYQSLLNLVPGATPASYQNAVIASPGRALATNVNGTSNTMSNTRLDGATNIRPSLSHQILYVAPADSIQTVNISTNNFDAEQGFAGGASVTVMTKSGTNRFHGTAYEYHTNSRVSAKNFFYLDANNPKNIINNFGGTLGGPIRKDKLFFFGSYEALRERGTFNSLVTVPTAEQRAGNFSSFGASIYDPATGLPDGSGRTLFPNNTIPLNRQSAITRKVQDLVPAPNQTGTANNYFAAAPTVFNRSSIDFKTNWNTSARTNLWAKYSAMPAAVTSQYSLGKAGGQGMINGGGVGQGNVLVQVMTIGGSRVLSPTFLVDGTASFARDSVDTIEPDAGTNFGLDVLGIPGTNGSDPRYSGFPRFSVDSYENYGAGHDWEPKILRNVVYTYTSNFSWTHGGHEVRFGIDIARFILDEFHPETNSPRGAFHFAGGVTGLKGGPSTNQFNSYASFLLGLPIDVGKSLQYLGITPRETQESLYIRDRWRATRKLTISLGLRWEYYPMMKLKDYGIARYEPATNKVLLGGAGNVPDNAGTEVSKKLFAPRVGFAYSADTRTVIRGGYGISYDPTPLSRNLLFLYPSVIAQTFPSANSNTAYGPIEKGIPLFSGPDLSSGVIDLPGTVSDTTLAGGHFVRAYIQSFNLIVERQLPGSFVASAGYVGTRTVHSIVSRNLNTAPAGGGTAGRILNALYGRTADTNLIDGFRTNTYDSLQANLNRRFSQGIMVRVGYTFAKAIDWSDGTGGGLTWNTASQLTRNRALAGFDRTHTLRMAWLAELPFGAGKRWANSGAGRKLLGGWQLNGIFSAYSGSPFTVSASGTSVNAPGGNSQTADQVLAEVKHLGGIGRLEPYFDPLAFRQPNDVRFGTTGRNLLRGPGTVNADLGLSREFRAGEKLRMKFLAEAFNFTNTPHFSNPGGSVANLRLNPDGTINTIGGFMTITSTTGGGGSNNPEGGPRQLRIALRLTF
jgi:hypothetical protein